MSSQALETDGEVDPQIFLDTREGPLAEQWGQQLVRRATPTLIRVVQKSKKLPEPPAESWLGRVDTRTVPFETSQQVRVFAQVAMDNLQEVGTILKKKLPLYSLYSMIRSAMEAASLGLWILDAKNEDLAASRTLRIYRQNIESDRTLWKTVVGRASGDHDGLLREAQKAHDALKGVHPTGFVKTVQSTSVIENVDRLHPQLSGELDIFSGLEVWRICSAVTHANQVSLLNILERHPDGPKGEPATRMSRISFVASFYSTAVHRTNLLIDSFEAKSKLHRGFD